MKRIVLLLMLVALMAIAVAGPAAAQTYYGGYCWAYDYYYGWYQYYC